MNHLKKCKKCGVYKPLSSDFWHKNKHMSDGYLNVCVKCTNKTNGRKPGTGSVVNYRKNMGKCVDNLAAEYVKNQLYKQGRDRKDITPKILREKKRQIIESRLSGQGNSNFLSVAELNRRSKSAGG